MTPVALKETLHALVLKNVPACLWGETGIGKSAIVRDIAHERQIGMIDVRVAVHDTMQALQLPQDAVHGGILFFDDVHKASPELQWACYTLIDNRRLGTFVLPDNWAIVVAATTQEKRHAYEMPPELRNRMVHLKMEVSPLDWRTWAFREKIDDSIISFLGLRPDALLSFDPTSKEKNFATPRSWAFVNTILSAKVKNTALFEALCGALGTHIAQEFLAYREEMVPLPAFHEIFEGRCHEYSKTPSGLHITASVLVTQALRHQEKIALNHMLLYLLKLEPEFAHMIVRDLQAQGIRLERLAAWKAYHSTFAPKA